MQRRRAKAQIGQNVRAFDGVGGEWQQPRLGKPLSQIGEDGDVLGQDIAVDF